MVKARVTMSPAEVERIGHELEVLERSIRHRRKPGCSRGPNFDLPAASKVIFTAGGRQVREGP